MNELAQMILELGTTICFICASVYACVVLWKQNRADREKHDADTKERENKYIDTIGNFSKSMDNFSATLGSIDNRIGNIETKVDKIEIEIENIKD